MLPVFPASRKQRVRRRTPGHIGWTSFNQLWSISRPKLLRIAEAAVRARPADPALLLMAALAGLLASQPDRSISYLKRFERKFETDNAVTLLMAFALARQGYTARAWTLLERNRLHIPNEAMSWFIGGYPMSGWLVRELTQIRSAHLDQQRAARSGEKRAPDRKAAAKPAPRPARTKAKPPAAEAPPPIPDLPRLEVPLALTFEFADADAIQLNGTAPDPTWFRLRAELTQLGLVEGFDELLCLPVLQGWKRTGIRSRRCARCSSSIAAGCCWPTRSGSARPSRPAWC